MPAQLRHAAHTQVDAFLSATRVENRDSYRTQPQHPEPDIDSIVHSKRTLSRRLDCAAQTSSPTPTTCLLGRLHQETPHLEGTRHKAQTWQSEGRGHHLLYERMACVGCEIVWLTGTRSPLTTITLPPRRALTMLPLLLLQHE